MTHMRFELSAEQTLRYEEWLRELARLHALEGENLDQVTISFTITPLGQFVIAHTGSHMPKDGHKLVLQDL